MPQERPAGQPVERPEVQQAGEPQVRASEPLAQELSSALPSLEQERQVSAQLPSRGRPSSQVPPSSRVPSCPTLWLLFSSLSKIEKNLSSCIGFSWVVVRCFSPRNVTACRMSGHGACHAVNHIHGREPWPETSWSWTETAAMIPSCLPSGCRGSANVHGRPSLLCPNRFDPHHQG